MRLWQVLFGKRLGSVRDLCTKTAQKQHTVSLLLSPIVFPINLLTQSGLSPMDELIPGTTRGMFSVDQYVKGKKRYVK